MQDSSVVPMAAALIHLKNSLLALTAQVDAIHDCADTIHKQVDYIAKDSLGKKS